MHFMRHSDSKLTLKTYTDGFVLSMAESIGKLPGMGDSLIDLLTGDFSCRSEFICGESDSPFLVSKITKNKALASI